MEFSKTQKNKDVALYLGYEYITFRKTNDVMTWRCRQHRSTKCRAFIKTKEGAIVAGPTEHCHDSFPQKASANIARSKMRAEIEAVTATPRSVIGNVLMGLPDDVLAHMPRQSTISRSLSYHKKKENFSNPENIKFTIPDKYKDFILYDSGLENPNRILMMGDKTLLMKLSHEDTIYGDGTFDKVPKIFFQLYTWHGKVGNSYPPCIYVLLSKKTLETYVQMLEIMKELIPNFAPKKILVDFEKACINAVNITFPEAEVKGCYFHLCQSIIRKIKNVGLKQDFETDLDVKLKIKSLAALSFVPMEDVKTCFNLLAATFPDEPCYNEVLTYFFSTYLESAAGRNPLFPINIWNHHEAALQGGPKTTNCCEGFHNTLNSLFHCSHPNLWLFFDGLQRDLACHKLTLAKANAGQPEVKRRKYENLQKMVAAAVAEYEQIENKLLYLRRIANLQ